MRYASTTPQGAARERYRDTGNRIPPDHADAQWTDLTGGLRVLDLRSNDVLDALGLDARISTGYERHVREACWLLSDRVRQWWGPDIDAIAYSSRTTPQGSTNVAFFEPAPLGGTSTRLADRVDLLDSLVLTAGFQIAFPY